MPPEDTAIASFQPAPNVQGRQAADDAGQLLTSLEKPRVLIVGHTDPKGPANAAENDRYNLRLSLDRAAAVKTLLVAGGYDASRIAVRGCGLRRPMTFDTPGKYSEAQIDQMLRRVEICFLDRPNSSPNCAKPEQPTECPR